MRRAAWTHIAACLHALVDEKEVIAPACGEQCCAKREAVDFPFDAEPAAHAPDFGNVEGDANDDPAETRRLHALKRSEEHTSELQSRLHLVCRLLLEKKKKKDYKTQTYT